MSYDVEIWQDLSERLIVFENVKKRYQEFDFSGTLNLIKCCTCNYFHANNVR